MMSNGTVQISLLEKAKVKIKRIANRFRACLHGGWGPHLSCKRDQIKMKDYVDRRVTPPTWGPPATCKQGLKGLYHALCYLFQNIKRIFASIEFRNLWSSFAIENDVIGIRPFSCRFSLRMARMETDWNLTCWANLSQVFMLCLQNTPKNYYG